MFPLVPDLISDELNLIVALLIGIAFGFILEQAGFSSSRKLAGLFYGYDFTVLRVFFTAGVTAMSGILILDYFGILDTEFMYVNPTYLWPAIVGGAIMGVGFVIGGYCPGTSICAAAIGKIDAMVFVLGGLLGVFLFAEGYPFYSEFYNGSFLGNIRIFNSIGVSQGVFALMLIIMAVGTFMMTTKIEQRVNANAESKSFSLKNHRFAGTGIIALGVVLVFLPDRKTHVMNSVNTEFTTAIIKQMTSDELAFRLIDKDPKIQIIDIRSENEFSKLALPGSVNIQMEKLFSKEYFHVLANSHKKKIFIANNDEDAKKAVLLSEKIGYENLSYLKGGMKEFQATILSYAPPQQILRNDEDANRFRIKAAVQVAQLIKEAKSGMIKAPKIIKKIAGGC
jgi:rhodanese-related sulfurtransferase